MRINHYANYPSFLICDRNLCFSYFIAHIQLSFYFDSLSTTQIIELY